MKKGEVFEGGGGRKEWICSYYFKFFCLEQFFFSFLFSAKVVLWGYVMLWDRICDGEDDEGGFGEGGYWVLLLGRET